MNDPDNRNDINDKKNYNDNNDSDTHDIEIMLIFTYSLY